MNISEELPIDIPESGEVLETYFRAAIRENQREVKMMTDLNKHLGTRFDQISDHVDSQTKRVEDIHNDLDHVIPALQRIPEIEEALTHLETRAKRVNIFMDQLEVALKRYSSSLAPK
eukprot:gnl/Dysnectes_brevis/4074_a5343_907.p1 GENE.gnl/Dysnectes_brevis/4074_a5343_907~~gnl/Dysnectes_brevis/4074_a5343_907.p1  ORF type:complete len:117 (-),score=12.75 gnl/Dysnectes_brevis/4074_a5343_907:60-410(-)